MKTNPFHGSGPVIMAWLALALGGMAEEAPNLLKNPGFEEEIKMKWSKSYDLLFEQGVQLPEGKPAIMPAEVYINPADGWSLVKEEAAFEYLLGKPGQEVHLGRRAIRVVSPKCSVGTAVGGKVELVEGVGLDENVINTDAVCPVTFYAKGMATVMVQVYLYDRRSNNICGEEYAASLKVEPAKIQVDDADKWKQYRATIQITNPKVTSILLVLNVRGDTAIDDVALRPK